MNEDVGGALIREMAWYDDYLAQRRRRPQRQYHPGNKKGGLANIVEKSLGSIVKSGSADRGRARAGREGDARKACCSPQRQRADFICGTLQLASGMTLQVFTTGRGTPYGLPQRPSSRSRPAANWRGAGTT